jgi:hypothetical protein
MAGMRTLQPGFALILAAFAAAGVVASDAASLHARQDVAANRSNDQPRTNHAVGAYDARLQRVVLIGAEGDPTSGQHDLVWSWSGTRWDHEGVAGPPARVNASAAFDSNRRALIVTGGSRKSADDGTWQVIGDSWEGDARGWRPLADIAPRDHHALVEDGRGGVLMFGGIPAERSAAWPADTWVLDGTTWRRVATSGPSARGRTALAYDSKRHLVILFGGVSAPSPGQSGPQIFMGDTWTWNGTEWKQATANGPRGRYAHGMVYDERAGVVWLYSGAAAHSGAPLSDMWRWDGSTWTEVPLSGPMPGARYQPVMVYDKARGRTVLYGGIDNASDTWEWDGERWRLVEPS